MKYTPGYQSKNTIDRRASSGRAGGAGVKVAGGGGVLLLLVTLLVGAVGGEGSGIDLGDVLAGLEGPSATTQTRDPDAPDPRAEQASFIQFAFDDAQDLWADVLRDAGRPYRDATLILYSDRTRSACGNATSAVGPFYCPADETVHIDLTFFDELARRFGAPGDFAQAYVVAHEVGHHVQNVLGVSDQVRQAQAQEPERRNEYSVLLELQADCFSGVWATGVEAQGLLERGDIDEGLAAAAAVGDDSIQSQAGLSIDPERFTHGTAAQRQEWFTRGFQTGDANECNTFGSFRLQAFVPQFCRRAERVLPSGRAALAAEAWVHGVG